MYQQLLLAYDGSEQGQNAILQCAEISQWTGATVTLVAIMPREMVFAAPEGGFYSPEQHAFEKQKYKLILDQGLRILGESGHVAEGVVLQGETIHEISKHARKVGADLIVIGHKHEKNWAARWWRGTSASSLIEHAPCSVLIVITP